MSLHPELIRARALALASCLVREVDVVRSASRSTGDTTRLRQLAEDNACLRELLAQPACLSGADSTTPAELSSRAPSRAFERVIEGTL